MIILASNSKRRQDILGRFVKYKIVTEDIKENNSEYDSPRQLVMALSFEKGIEVAKKNKEDIILSADTVVSLEGEVLGKPKDRLDAENMLKKLSDTEHLVLTGYSIFKLDENIKYTNYEVSKVRFKKLDDEMINSYLDTKEYIDKAGSYGIQGYGALLVESIKGDYENIVGLPISKIAHEFRRLFNINLLSEGLKWKNIEKKS